MDLARIVKLKKTNYEAWCFSMKALLRREKLWKYVDPGTPPNPVTEAWTEGDESALTTIQLAVDESQFRLIQDMTTAKDTWAALKDYHQKASLGQKVTLLKQITNQNYQCGDDMEAYLADIEKMYVRLENSGFEMKECLKVALILRGLPDSFNPLTTALEARDEEELTLDLVKVKLIDEADKQRKQRSGSDEQVLRTGSGKTQRSVTCYYCGQEGHLKRNCKAFLEEIGKKKKDEAKTVRESENNSFTFMVRSSARDANTWVVDSGASSHMANNRKAFSKLDTSVCEDIWTANGKKIRTGGIGECVIECVDSRNRKVSITLTDVLYAPALKENLVSVSKLTVKNVKLEFDSEQCKLVYGREVIATAGKVDGLYVMNLSKESALLTGSEILVAEKRRKHRGRKSRNAGETTKKEEKSVNGGTATKLSASGFQYGKGSQDVFYDCVPVSETVDVEEECWRKSSSMQHQRGTDSGWLLWATSIAAKFVNDRSNP